MNHILAIIVYSYLLIYNPLLYMKNLSHSHQLLSRGRVNGNTAVKVSLGSTHLDGNTEALQNLITALAKDVQTNDLLVRTFTDKLVSSGTLVFGLHHGVVHGSEAGGVNLDGVTELLAGLGLGKTDAADSGVGEDDRGDVGIVKVGILLSAEETVTETTTSGDGNGGQLGTGVANISKSVNAVNVGVLVLVDLDVVLVVSLDASVLQLELLNLGGTTDGPQDAVDIHSVFTVIVLVVQLLQAITQVLKLALRAIGVNVKALTSVLFHNLVLDHGVESTQELVMTDEQVGLSTEVVEHASHLDSNVTSTNNSDLLGLLLKIEEAITVDAELGTLDVDCAGTTTNSDEDLLCADLLLLTVLADNLDNVLGDERGGSVEVFDLVVLQVLLVNSVQTLDVGVTLVLEGGPVEGSSLLDGETVGLGLVDSFLDGGGVPGDLLGHTSTVMISD
jgi:hypothetical protein